MYIQSGFRMYKVKTCICWTFLSKNIIFNRVSFSTEYHFSILDLLAPRLLSTPDESFKSQKTRVVLNMYIPKTVTWLSKANRQLIISRNNTLIYYDKTTYSKNLDNRIEFKYFGELSDLKLSKIYTWTK